MLLNCVKTESTCNKCQNDKINHKYLLTVKFAIFDKTIKQYLKNNKNNDYQIHNPCHSLFWPKRHNFEENCAFLLFSLS